MNDIFHFLKIYKFINELRKTYIFYWKKSNFEPTGNSEPTTEYLALGKPLATFPYWNSFFFFFFFEIFGNWNFSSL